MRVEILGTTGYHPTEQRHTSCVLLPELGIVFDAGTAAFRLPDRAAIESLDIFLSHTHLDHVAGLTFFFTWIVKRSFQQISVHAEERKLTAVREHLFSPDLFPVMPPYAWCPLQGEGLQIRGAKITWFPLKHPGGSIGYRLEYAGKSLAYVTDTMAEPNADYLSAIRGVDLLLHECNFPDGQEELAERTGHSCLTPVVKLAVQAGVKRLVLTHLDPVLEITSEMLAVARQIFPATELSHDGYCLEV